MIPLVELGAGAAITGGVEKMGKGNEEKGSYKRNWLIV